MTAARIANKPTEPMSINRLLPLSNKEKEKGNRSDDVA